MSDSTHRKAPLAGLRVVDASNILAGPISSQMLADYGADVIKLELPGVGDSSRGNDRHKDGEPLWWRFLARNKRTMGLNVHDREGADIFRRLCADADVLIENFRPGTLERWGVGPEVLHADNPRLVIARITGFGQHGPYANRAAFGTLIECMSGFAHMTGAADGPPTLPPFGLADHLAGITTACAVMIAIHERESSGLGQIVDLALLQPMMAALGPYILWEDQLGVSARRTGNRTDGAAPRDIYECSDGRWVGFSASSDAVAERMMVMIGRPELIKEPWFAGGGNRARHADDLDVAMKEWLALHTRDEVLAAANANNVPAAPVYDAAGLMADEHVVVSEMVTTVLDEKLGPIRMQNVPFRLSRTPGAVRFPGRPLGADTTSILREKFGMKQDEVDALRSRGVIA